jgi:energy-coupling factor transport system ATP-binding protein
MSGGQKRRVAFAGVIAMDPDILVLDEPAAGLDPTGRREILEYAAKLKALGKTVIIVSHNMDEAAKYADRILVLKNGKATLPMTPRELFTDEEQLKASWSCAPEIITCLRELKKEIPEIRPCYFRSSDAADEIIRAAVCARRPAPSPPIPQTAAKPQMSVCRRWR